MMINVLAWMACLFALGFWLIERQAGREGARFPVDLKGAEAQAVKASVYDGRTWQSVRKFVLATRVQLLTCLGAFSIISTSVTGFSVYGWPALVCAGGVGGATCVLAAFALSVTALQPIFTDCTDFKGLM